MSVYHITPYMKGNIGGGINDHIRHMPKDAWVCLRDADTMFLTSSQQLLVDQIAHEDPPFALIGCMTNRIRAPWQLHGGQISDNPNIDYHMRIARDREASYGGQVIDAAWPVAGFFMLFRRMTWMDVGGFPERTAYFDKEFSRAVLKHDTRFSGRLGIAIGLYLWHSYRLGSADPVNDVAHLAGAGL